MRHFVVAAGLLREGRIALDAKAGERPTGDPEPEDAAPAPSEVLTRPEPARQAPAVGGP